MPLSADLITNFIKNTKDDEKATKETIVYGKIIKQDDSGTCYVQIDGAADNQLVAVSQITAHVDLDERVIVMIKNRSAIITGNISAPAAGTVYVNATVEEKMTELSSITSDYIDELWADYESSK